VRLHLACILVAACGGGAAPAPQNPLHMMGGCDTAPAGKRSLAASIDVERGAGTIDVDGTKQAGCALYELTPGVHHVTVSANGAGGFGVRAKLQVVDPPTSYDLFDLQCGRPGSCDTQTLRAWETAVVADRTRMTDPCSAAKLTGIRWSTEQLDDVHPKSLELSFDIHVYTQASGKPPHDPSCPDK
jgi:hypothetical protein